MCQSSILEIKSSEVFHGFKGCGFVQNLLKQKYLLFLKNFKCYCLQTFTELSARKHLGTRLKTFNWIAKLCQNSTYFYGWAQEKFLFMKNKRKRRLIVV